MNKIAIIGMSCLFPGASNLEEFWETLISGKDSTCLESKEHLGTNPDLFFDKNKGKEDKFYNMAGGMIENFNFDPGEYNLSQKYAEQLDNVHKWTLYSAKEALRDSGYLGKSHLTDCGIILGNLSLPTRNSYKLHSELYSKLADSEVMNILKIKKTVLGEGEGFYSSIYSNAVSFPAVLAAKSFSLKGPNLVIDAACASSLFAVKMACSYLVTGKADLMLAGAVCAPDPVSTRVGFSLIQSYPESGKSKSKPLDRNSGGITTSEGAGMVVLKRFDDALRDGDKIYGCILGVGLSNDGSGKHSLSPSTKGQILAYKRAYSEAGIEPGEISYIDCHATGTSLGDKTETESLEHYFYNGKNTALLGAVKSNIGHLLSGSGMAGLFKVILSMNKGIIPHTLYLEEPVLTERKAINSNSFVKKATPWPSKDLVKKGGVNAFGFGGCNSHLVLEQGNLDDNCSKKSSKEKALPDDRVAIVGMGAHFGCWKSLEQFEKGIYNGHQNFTPLKSERWGYIDNQKEIIKEFGVEKIDDIYGGFIDDIEMDLSKYRIPPDMKDIPIAQQLLVLKVATEALQSSAIKKGGNVAVIVAAETDPSIHQYLSRVYLSKGLSKALEESGLFLTEDQYGKLEEILKGCIYEPLRVNRFTSFIGNIMASRISSLWDFSGPSFTISASENSVYKALEAAQMLLCDSELDAVVVGAVDMAGGIERVLQHLKDNPVNTGKVSFGFEKDTNGWLIGEGAGAVVLKRLKDLDSNCDRIYAVIESVGLSKGLQYDSRKEQKNCYIDTWKKTFGRAKLRPEEVGYIEVSGSGFAQEDDAEIDLLCDLSRDGTIVQDTAIGCVKSNIGHTYIASGMAALIKAALCIHNRYIPAVPNWSSPKKPDEWVGKKFYVATESRPWVLKDSSMRRGAVLNGISSDDSFANLILSEYPLINEQVYQTVNELPVSLFPVAANSSSELFSGLKELRQIVENSDSIKVAVKEALQAAQKRQAAKYAAVIVGGSKDAIITEIDHALKGVDYSFQNGVEWSTPAGSYFTPNPLSHKGGVAFAFPGGFNSYPGICKELFRLFPEIYNIFPKYGSFFGNPKMFSRSMEKPSLENMLRFEEEFINDPIAMLISGGACAIYLTAILKNCFGIKPGAAFGYSLGELSMQFSLGAWDDVTEMMDSFTSSQLFKTVLSGPGEAVRKLWDIKNYSNSSFDECWNNYVLLAGPNQVIEALKVESRVFLTHINTPGEVVIGGYPEDCERVIERLKCSSYRAPFNQILHCDPTKIAYDEFVSWFSVPVFDVPKTKLYFASDDFDSKTGEQNTAQKIASSLCRGLNYPQMVNKVYDEGARIFIEVGAGNTCSRWIRDILKDRENAVIHTNSRGVPDIVSIIRALAKLIGHRVDVNLLPIIEMLKIEPVRTGHMQTIRISGPSILNKLKNSEIRKSLASVIESASKNKKEVVEIREEENHHGNLFNSTFDMCKKAMMIEKLNNSVQSAFLNTRYSEMQMFYKLVQLQSSLFKSVLLDGTKELITTYKRSMKKAVFNENDLLEFAKGKLALVFGKDYEEIDKYEKRVRLPMPPYMFVSRVTRFDAQRDRFGKAEIETEYDVPKNAWYTLEKNIPWAVAFESSHGHMLLVSFMGVDFENKGNRVYRILDADSTFISNLPKEGETIRCRMEIEKFVRNGEKQIFYFTCNYFVGDRQFMSLKATSGFFSREELMSGQGIRYTEIEKKNREKILKRYFSPVLICNKKYFSEQDITNLSLGNLTECFGQGFGSKYANPYLHLPSNPMLMIDRVTGVDREGGSWGLGLLTAEKDIDINDWYFSCHFKNDLCMPGAVMGEGCAQLIYFYALYLGLHKLKPKAQFQPKYNLTQSARYRGQVLPTRGKLEFRLEISELGIEPAPYVVGIGEIIFNGKTIALIKDLSVQLADRGDI